HAQHRLSDSAPGAFLDHRQFEFRFGLLEWRWVYASNSSSCARDIRSCVGKEFRRAAVFHIHGRERHKFSVLARHQQHFWGNAFQRAAPIYWSSPLALPLLGILFAIRIEGSAFESGVLRD